MALSRAVGPAGLLAALVFRLQVFAGQEIPGARVDPVTVG